MKKFESTIKEIYRNYQYEEDVEKVLTKIKNYKNFIIFGAGQLGHKVYNILEEYGEKASSFCDNKLFGNIDGNTGLKIISLNELKEDKNKTFMIIAVFDDKAYQVVYRQLLDFGFEEKQLLCG